MSENDLEKPGPDAAEQETPADAENDELDQEGPGALPLDANEADASEQHREVHLDEDEYR